MRNDNGNQVGIPRRSIASDMTEGVVIKRPRNVSEELEFSEQTSTTNAGGSLRIDVIPPHIITWKGTITVTNISKLGLFSATNYREFIIV